MANDRNTQFGNAYFSDSSPVTNRTLSVTVPGGLSNSKMLLFIGATNGPITGSGLPAISSCTINGNAMSPKTDTGGVSQLSKAFLYEYDSPTSGTYNISVTFTLDQDGVILSAILYEDCDEDFYRSTPVIERGFDAAGPPPGTSVSISADSGDECVSFFMGDDDGGGTLGDVSNTTGATALFDYDGDDLSNYYAGQTAVRTASSTGTHTETFTLVNGVGGNVNTIIIAVGSGSAGSPPANAPTIDSVTPSITGGSVTYSHSGGDADGFEFEIDNSGTWHDIENDEPFLIQDYEPLAVGSNHDIRMRAYNASGNSAESSPTNFNTLDAIQSITVLERTENSVSLRLAVNITSGSIMVSLVPEDDEPSHANIWAGWNSGGDPNYALGWLGSGLITVSGSGNYDIALTDWIDPETATTINPLTALGTFNAAASAAEDASGTPQVGNEIYQQINPFSESFISMPVVYGITATGGIPRVCRGRSYGNSEGNTGGGIVVEADSEDGTMYLVIVPDSGDPGDWPSDDQIAEGDDGNDDPAEYADSKAVAVEYKKQFFDPTSANLGGLLLTFDEVTTLDPETDYVACFVQDTGTLSNAVYFQFTTEETPSFLSAWARNSNIIIGVHT